MKKLSAGLLVYRFKNKQLEVMVVHMGSPWWAKKDKGAWSIPKGEYPEGEDALQNAKREFAEELGQPAPEGKFMELGHIEQKNNKTVSAWAVEAELDVSNVKSNTFTIEWPPRSGKMTEFPEIDRAGWLTPKVAASKIIPEQIPFLQRLCKNLGINFHDQDPTEEDKQASLF